MDVKNKIMISLVNAEVVEVRIISYGSAVPNIFKRIIHFPVFHTEYIAVSVQERAIMVQIVIFDCSGSNRTGRSGPFDYLNRRCRKSYGR